MPEQMQEQKNKLLKAILNEGMVSEKDVAEAIKAVLGVVAKLKEELVNKMATNKGEMDTECEAMMRDISEMEKKMSDMQAKLSDKMAVDNSKLRNECMQMVKEVEDMIPTIPSFEPLEKRIEEVAAKIPKIPDEITPDRIANKLNELEEAVEIEVIKGLKKKLEDLEKKWASRPMFGGGGFSKIAMDSHFIENEIVSGSGTTFTLSHTPSPASSLKLYGRGQRLRPTTDFTISGTTITTIDTWSSGDIIGDFNI